MADDLSDLEIAVLCDLLAGPGANLKARKRAGLDPLIAKRLVEPVNDDPTNSRSLTRLTIFSRIGAWALEHDPEKWKPIFRKDHAPTMITRP